MRKRPVASRDLADLGRLLSSDNEIIVTSKADRNRSMTKTDISQLTQLGSAAPLPSSPAEAILERVPNSNLGMLYLVPFAVPEFTSICPMTGQPDFAHLVIDYVPSHW